MAIHSSARVCKAVPRLVGDSKAAQDARKAYKPRICIPWGNPIAIASAPAVETWERRIQAAAVFWFLSGIRIKAFTTLPILAVDLEKQLVNQFPSLGVHTKNQKHAVTFLLQIPELLEVIQSWDEEVRSKCPLESPWFVRISPDTRDIDPQGYMDAGKHRDCRARKDLKRWMGNVNLPYHSPHKFRHGHAVYGLKHSRDVADLKAISQNLMHSSLSITDGVYGILSDDDMKLRISSIGKDNHDSRRKSREKYREVLKQIIHELGLEE